MGMVGLLTGLNDCTLKLGFWIARTITLGEIPSPNRHSELFLYLSKTFYRPDAAAARHRLSAPVIHHPRSH